MPASAFECVLDIQAGLGECPVWSPEEQVLYWVDITRPSLNRFDPNTRHNRAMPMPAAIGSFALRQSCGFIVALRHGIWLADADGVLVHKVADAPFDGAHHRFNDGKCDRQGRFFVGSMNERRDAANGGLWRVDADLELTQVLDHVTVSNALAWSPDGLSMYHADTSLLTVRKFAYDTVQGRPFSPQVFAQWSSEDDRPDGAAVDAEGNFWLALYRGGRVVKMSAEGQLLAQYPIPAKCPTMCAFGGPDFRTLYVTTVRNGRDAAELAAWPCSGGIFAMRVEVGGMPEPKFAA